MYLAIMYHLATLCDLFPVLSSVRLLEAIIYGFWSSTLWRAMLRYLVAGTMDYRVACEVHIQV